MLKTKTLGISLMLVGSLYSCKDSDNNDSPAVVAPSTVIDAYADLVYANYQASLVSAQALKDSIDTFVAAPSEAGLSAAKEAWLASRDPYGQTEAFRFYDGPIDSADGPEGQLNAWPMDEAYLDYVEGSPEGGLINSSIAITKSTIANLNEGGEGDVLGVGAGFDSEKAIASGYHAIEFLLWGQDLSATGPGARPWQDFLTGEQATAVNGDRRGLYLQYTAELLVDDLTSLVAAWSPDDASNYRNAEFLSLAETDALRAIFTSIGILAKGELAGERIDVALSTQEQEDEHSCFSDNTYADIYANALGIQNVYLGRYGNQVDGASISDLVAAVNPTLDTEIKTLLEEALALTQGLPLTFDQMIGIPNGDGWNDLNSIVIKLQSAGDKLAEAAADIGLGSISVELPE